MGHLADHILLSYVDDELSLDERAEVEVHLGACESCVEVLAGLRTAKQDLSEGLACLDVPAPVVSASEIRERLLSRALEQLDTPVPELTLEEVRGRPGSEPGVEPTDVRPLRRRFLSRRPLMAAALIVILLSGASAAIPGSPVRAWLTWTIEQLAFVPGRPAAPPPDESGEKASGRASAVSVQPKDGLVRIMITGAAPETMIRLRLLNRGPASVWSVDGRYRTAPGEIEVLDAGPGDVLVYIPRSMPTALVEVNGRLVAIKEGPDLKLLTPAADSSDTEVSFPAGG